MKIVERRFLRGPNIHWAAPCMVSVLDLEGHRPVGIEDLLGGATVLQSLLQPPGPGAIAPALVDAAEAARLVARLLSAVQARAGQPLTFCEVLACAPAPAPARYRVVCSYQHEAVAAAALVLAVDILTALFQRLQPADLEARIGVLRAVADGQASHRADAAPLRTARAAAIPVVAITGTNGKTTTTQLIAHVLRASGLHTGMTTTQGIYIGGECVQKGDCSGYWSARRVLDDASVQAAALETARGGILKRGLAFDQCDVGVVLNVSSDHLGLDGVETLHDLAHVKGLVARHARDAAVLNADDAWCVAMRETLAPGCAAVFFALDAANPVLRAHLQAGGAGAWLADDGWLMWGCAGNPADGVNVVNAVKVVSAAELPFTCQGHARYNTANALAALAALCCMGHATEAIAQAMTRFVSDAKSNPLRGNQFEVDGVRLIVDYAHNAVACRALCEMARSLAGVGARLLGVVTSPGDRRAQDLYETGRVCGHGFDELVVYEHDPRGRSAGATSREILRGARSAAAAKPLHAEPCIRHALARGLAAAREGDVLVFTCAGNFDDLVEGVRLRSPAAAQRIAHALAA